MNIKLRSVAFKNGKYGFTNQAGETVIPPVYDVSEGLEKVGKGGWEFSKYGFVNKAGKEVIPLVYDDADSFEYDNWWCEVQASVRKDEESFYINKREERVRRSYPY